MEKKKKKKKVDEVPVEVFELHQLWEIIYREDRYRTGQYLAIRMEHKGFPKIEKVLEQIKLASGHTSPDIVKIELVQEGWKSLTKEKVV